MPISRIVATTLLALIAFAGNSLLCRAALSHTSIDPATFTTGRMLSGAIALWIIVFLRKGGYQGRGSWLSAFALCAYAVCFSFSYVHLTAASGALILFGTVQATMIGYGLRSGERMRPLQITGFVLACSGLVGLLLPGLSAPPLFSASLMIAAGIAWGIYSIHGKGAGDPLKVTAGNFLRAAPMALAVSAIYLNRSSFDATGLMYAVLSGALASGIGYAIWYTALPFIRSTIAATVQLAVPIIASMGSVLFLHEALTLRLIVASIVITGGVALVIFMGNKKQN
ncbi:MAG TPA: DMT family transporter [Steroidobacteraceae bacterium]|nr:DMT family transporter [Steroidobacteraceae bacterium]